MFKNTILELGMVANTCIPIAWNSEGRRAPQVWGQPFCIMRLSEKVKTKSKQQKILFGIFGYSSELTQQYRRP